jgi:ribosomal protein S18 acetylase RimI-like enzyme
MLPVLVAPVIRKATHADEAALAALDRTTWSARTTPSPMPDADRPFFGERAVPEEVLVADDGGEVVGYAHLAHPTRLESNRHVLQLRGLSVDPRRQREGIGRMLLEAAIDDAAERGASRVTLRVLSTNAPALAAYAACAFEVEGVQRGEFRLDGEDVDDVLMARSIGS